MGIKPGDQITMSYSNGHPSPGIDVLAKHGFFADAAKDNWSSEDCTQIRKVVTPEVAKSSKMFEAVGKLVDQNCGAPTEEAQPTKIASMSDSAKAEAASDSAKAEAATKTANA